MNTTSEPVTSSFATRKPGGSFKKVQLLTRDQEVDLARKYRETHDPAVARSLIESHLALVVKIARQCCSRNSMIQDAIQEGCLGLIRAVEKFDPDRGIRLSSYAAWWIRAFVYQYIMANSRMMKVATTFAQRKLFFNLHRECRYLEREGHEADSKDIAQRLGVAEKTVVEMRTRLGGREVPFETTVAVDAAASDESLGGMAAPQRPDELVEGHQFQAAVRKKLAEVATTLDARERLIFDARLAADKPLTLRELGARMNVSRERARQLEDRLKERLRPIFLDLLGDERHESLGHLDR